MSGPAKAVRALLLAAALLGAGGAAPARADDTAGDFDFYVLSLSWSPSWCEAEGDRDDPQCDGRRPYAFVVHGLWPQYERGSPQFCDARRGPSNRELESMLDLTPSRGLLRYQWRKHGSCSGLSPAAYYDLVRAVRGTVVVPEAYRRLARWTSVDPDRVEADFRAANPSLSARAVAVTCDDRRLREVRICVTRDGRAFRDCPEVDRRDCRADRVAMPPVR